MENRAEKLAARAMLLLSDAERARYAKELDRIFSMTDTLCAAAGYDAEPLTCAVRTDSLRPDDAPAQPDEARRLIALSKYERDGYVCIARTVG